MHIVEKLTNSGMKVTILFRIIVLLEVVAKIQEDSLLRFLYGCIIYTMIYFPL